LVGHHSEIKDDAVTSYTRSLQSVGLIVVPPRLMPIPPAGRRHPAFGIIFLFIRLILIVQRLFDEQDGERLPVVA
jgi:hypothetical protein